MLRCRLLNSHSATFFPQAVGAGVYTNMCNEYGGVECDLTVHRVQSEPTDNSEEDRFYIVSGGLTATHDFDWIQSIIRQKGFDCKLTDHTEVSDDKQLKVASHLPLCIYV